MDELLARNLVNRVAIGDILRRRARDTPDAIALVDRRVTPPVRLTYMQLEQRANRFARLFRALGAVKGDRIALMAPNCLDVAGVAYGCFKAGMVYVPLNFLMNVAELALVINHARPTGIVVHPSLWSIWEAVSPHLSERPSAILLGDVPLADQPAADELLNGLSGEPIVDVIIEDRDPAQIIYTSGTTSQPKGAVHTHLSVTMWMMSMALAFKLHPGDSYICPLPFFHIGGQSHMLSHHLIGGRYVFADFEAARFADLIVEEQVNGVFLLPMMWRALLELPNIGDYDFRSVKRALYAMAPMSDRTLAELRAVFDCPFDQASGQTETSIMTMFLDDAPREFSDRNYWGRAIMTADQAVLGEDGAELPPGEVGEICWRGPTIMSGYLNDESANEAVTRYGWHHSGDLGLIDQAGQLVFVDRKKDMIKSGGENVSSIRVEQIIVGIAGVKAAAVVGLPHPRWQEGVTAFVVADSRVDKNIVLAECRQHLAGYEVPKHVEFLPALPMTAAGKVLKKDLQSRYRNLYD